MTKMQNSNYSNLEIKHANPLQNLILIIDIPNSTNLLTLNYTHNSSISQQIQTNQPIIKPCTNRKTFHSSCKLTKVHRNRIKIFSNKLESQDFLTIQIQVIIICKSAIINIQHFYLVKKNQEKVFSEQQRLLKHMIQTPNFAFICQSTLNLLKYGKQQINPKTTENTTPTSYYFICTPQNNKSIFNQKQNKTKIQLPFKISGFLFIKIY
eukprot:TRINITY_DN2656_c0_g1_i3.p1 TRINITY_DN2656_c0_g1~~TRINITY_DN2656_c0_g1_i3.p1  ORF type:complete len:217 (+),score=-9.41 TRINITY_DN2656_c0_g1_i3:27-653(+)